MKQNIFSPLVRRRLSELGLSHIPANAITHIEAEMAAAFARLVARKLNARLVSRSILKAVRSANPASLPLSEGVTQPKP